MAFVNLPPNLQDIFYGLSDRIAKLETGPNQAMDFAQSAQTTAQDAQSTASQAQVQAINAAVQANIAQSQATTAQATATFAQSLAYAAQATANNASAQATVAQTTANGKNTVYYSLVTPGTTANTAGDIWFQYSGSGLVIGQWVGLGGTSWQQQTITQAVIGNLDAGKITTGILNAIEINAGSGFQSFRVTPTGYLTAQGAYIKGNITADSGTFNGSIYSSQGLFGSGSNYWQIGATGLTGIGNATITAGAITGSTITGGLIQTSAVTGVKLVGSTNSLSFMNSGTYVGHILNLSSQGILMHYGATPSSTAGAYYPYQYLSSGTLFMASNSTTSISLATTIGYNASSHNFFGTLITADTISANGDVNCNAELRAAWGASIPQRVTNTPNAWMSTSGQLRYSTSSSLRYKTDVVNLIDVPELNPQALYNLPVRAFRFKENALSLSDDRYGVLIPGFIAEEVDAIYPQAADYENGYVENWNLRTMIPAMLALIQEQNERIKILEGR